MNTQTIAHICTHTEPLGWLYRFPNSNSSLYLIFLNEDLNEVTHPNDRKRIKSCFKSRIRDQGPDMLSYSHRHCFSQTLARVIILSSIVPHKRDSETGEQVSMTCTCVLDYIVPVWTGTISLFSCSKRNMLMAYKPCKWKRWKALSSHCSQICCSCSINIQFMCM